MTESGPSAEQKLHVHGRKFDLIKWNQVIQPMKYLRGNRWNLFSPFMLIKTSVVDISYSCTPDLR